jgi:DNA replication protein DnaC
MTPRSDPLPKFFTLGDVRLAKMHAEGALFLAGIRSALPPYWLTLWGRNGYGNGTGKTFLARMVADAARKSFGCSIPCMFIHWPTLCDRMQRQEETGRKFAFAEEAGLLVIDDIGAEHQTPAMLTKLCRLLESRLRRWTILTTNLSPDDWQERDARISSRIIRDGSRHVRCETTDYSARKLSA